MFERRLVAGWGDMDFNSHMRNTAYLDKAADVRMMFFAEHGFPMSEFARLRLGPVIMKDEIEYYREVNLLDEVRVTLAIAGRGRRWQSIPSPQRVLPRRRQAGGHGHQHGRLARSRGEEARAGARRRCSPR